MRLLVLGLFATLAYAFFDPRQLTQEVSARFNSTNGSLPLVDGQGQPTSDYKRAWGIPYSVCVNLTSDALTNAWKLMTWNQFVPMFATWLLPWLALTAQFPYGTKDRTTDLMSFFLILGSPMLAAYSLSLMTLNSRWINREFRKIRKGTQDLRPERPEQLEAIAAVHWILSEIQHVSVAVYQGPNYDLAQMTVRPENAASWEQLSQEIFKTKKQKTLSLFAQLGWVIVTQVLSIVQFFTTGADDNAIIDGLAISTLWSWMLPLIWGWVFVGTQTRQSSIRDAFEEVHTRLVDENGNERFRCILDRREETNDAEVATFLGFSIAGWEKEPGPLFVFARVHTHMTACEHIRRGFEALLRKQQERMTVHGRGWNDKGWRDNLKGTPAQMSQYIFGEYVRDVEVPENSSVPDMPSGDIDVNSIIAGFIGLLLQWGTTGSAILIGYMTPVVGLGCCSGAYLFYGAAATLVWFLQVLSASLSHEWSKRRESKGVKAPARLILGTLAVYTRLIGNALAVLNAVWVITFSTLQFTNLYNSCWCASSALQHGTGPGSWIAILATPAEFFAAANRSWIVGTFLAIFCSAFCLLFFILAKGSTERPLRKKRDHATKVYFSLSTSLDVEAERRDKEE